MERFPIRFDRWYRPISMLALIKPTSSYVEVGEQVIVHMGWAFHAAFPREVVVRAEPRPTSAVSRGVHGWSGRWLVNGSGSGLVTMTLEPEQVARVTGVRVRLRELIVSIDDPARLIAALA